MLKKEIEKIAMESYLTSLLHTQQALNGLMEDMINSVKEKMIEVEKQCNT